MKTMTKVITIALLLGSVAFSSLANENTKPTNQVTDLKLYNKKVPATTVIQDDKIIVCENKTVEDIAGVFQRIKLNQKEIKPIFFSADSKAENVSGSKNSGYSIYLDITHSDGTKTYGIGTRFKTGTHDWETASKSYTPKKPIKIINFHLLFRKHTGKVWFKNIVLIEEEKK